MPKPNPNRRKRPSKAFAQTSRKTRGESEFATAGLKKVRGRRSRRRSWGRVIDGGLQPIDGTPPVMVSIGPTQTRAAGNWVIANGVSVRDKLVAGFSHADIWRWAREHGTPKLGQVSYQTLNLWLRRYREFLGIPRRGAATAAQMRQLQQFAKQMGGGRAPLIDVDLTTSPKPAQIAYSASTGSVAGKPQANTSEALGGASGEKETPAQRRQRLLGRGKSTAELADAALNAEIEKTKSGASGECHRG
ncbi:MAG: hypothetical protein BWY57_00625 [Betaproteobacteria bacterium ADurb.Bin341]|nr:MAG: hypothetical protein BWY57_00625 [Betaproteobacteria bacterium ADurb.Bin341]